MTAKLTGQREKLRLGIRKHFSRRVVQPWIQSRGGTPRRETLNNGYHHHCSISRFDWEKSQPPWAAEISVISWIHGEEIFSPAMEILERSPQCQVNFLFYSNLETNGLWPHRFFSIFGIGLKLKKVKKSVNSSIIRIDSYFSRAIIGVVVFISVLPTKAPER